MRVPNAKLPSVRVLSGNAVDRLCLLGGTITKYPAGLSMNPVPALERESDLIHLIACTIALHHMLQSPPLGYLCACHCRSCPLIRKYAIMIEPLRWNASDIVSFFSLVEFSVYVMGVPIPLAAAVDLRERIPCDIDICHCKV